LSLLGRKTATMVLIAAAVCSKTGKAITSRQFVEMTKSRIEGLLAAFPKLMSSDKQHTFVETDSVRYVYQPIDSLYMLLITTKTSNILEDLETLRLFSRVVADYCQRNDETEILENSFNLIFAFDEIVALGYRESVNMGQIRTFVEMDSHEEKVYNAVRETQEKEAKIKMREEAKRLQRMKLEAGKSGGKFNNMSGGGGGGSKYSGVSSAAVDTPSEPPKPATYSRPAARPTKAMKLGGKSNDADSFLDQLAEEGVKVAGPAQAAVTAAGGKTAVVEQVKTEPVHVSIEEKMTLSAGRDGGLTNMEVMGMMTLHIRDEQMAKVRLKIQGTDNKNIQMQTHPNIDKELFKSRGLIGLKNPAKPFPLNTGVGVLKWRFQTSDETNIPLSINCWPSDNGDGGCDVNIEFELEDENIVMEEVVITVNIPHGVGSPNIAECDGEYKYDSRKGALLWQHAIIDRENKSGSMEFSVGGNPDDFFPVTLEFTSSKSYSGIALQECLMVDGGEPIKYSSQVAFFPEKYEIV